LETLAFLHEFQGKAIPMSSGRDKKSTSSASQSEGLRGDEDETKLDLRSSDDLKGKKLDRYQAKKIAQEILREGTFSFTSHCHVELKNDSMDTEDVVNVLRCGKVEREPEPSQRFGSWRYQIETNRMAFVIEIHSRLALRVITAWRKKKS
jgi:hypothetical protein